MGRKEQRPEKETEKRVVKRLPHYGCFDYARLGYFSLTTKDTKFISSEDAITIDGTTETPGFFFGQFMKGLWVGKRNASELNLSYPYKAVPGKYPNCVYIDIRQAFRQISTAFGMECFIEEGRYVAYGETVPDTECFNDKICRGLLVTGVSKTGAYQEWINRDIRTVRFSNPNFAPHVSHSIWATLHAIQAVLSPISVYAHTDGCIVPSRHAAKAFAILNSYGFEYTIKGSGATTIHGVGSYRIGGNETRLHLRSQNTRVYIREDNSKWWLDKFQQGLSARTRDNRAFWRAIQED